MHFLRLPIEDDLAATQPWEPLGVSLNGSQPALAPSQQPIPFADTGNPIMAQVKMKIVLIWDTAISIIPHAH